MDKFRIGTVYNGFALKSIDAVPSYSSEGYLFEHESGFKAYWLKNEDKERFFSYTIYTPPFDNTGVFHILEHTLLTGSEKYPVKDPFMGMVRNSCNTFLNAMTGPDRTYFPAASPVKKDFDNIFRVYTDAVFSPLLRKESFEQEGIRLSAKGGLHYEGVVFSEMQGDISQHESVVASASARPLFDADSPYQYEFGGNPPDIPSLTYEAFIAAYKKHYVPANMTLFLYGDLEVDEYLGILNDEYLKDRDKGYAVERAGFSMPWNEPKSFRALSNAEDGEAGSTVMLSWLLNGVDDPFFGTELSLVVDILLGNPGSPLYKAIVESGLGKDISSESGLSDSYREYIFSAGISGADEKDEKRIEDYMLSSLESIVERGLDSKAVQAALRRMEFKLREIPGGIPQGYRLFFMLMDKGWVYGRNPSDMLQSGKILDEIKARLEKDPRYFEKWIDKNLINNMHRLRSVVVPSPEADKQMQDGIETMLSSHKGDYSSADEALFDEFQMKEDSAELLSSLPRLSSDDIPNEKGIIERKIEDNLIFNELQTGGIVYADIAFDISDYSLNELEDAMLLSRLFSMGDVGEMAYSEFLTELNYTTGGASFNIDSGSDAEGNFKAYLICRFKSLKEHLEESYNLILKAFRELNVESESRIKASLIDIDTEYQSSVLRQGHTFALSSASAPLSLSLYMAEKLQGLEYWFRVKEMLKNELDELPKRLRLLLDKTFSRERMKIHLAFETSDKSYVMALTKQFAAEIPDNGGLEAIERAFVYSGNMNHAYLAATPVSYSALASASAPFGSIMHAKEKMFLSIAGQNILWSLIREKGGAYGAGSLVDSNENALLFYTYRDPRLKESIDDFMKGIREQVITEEKLEDARLSVLSRDVRPLSPQSKAMIDFKRYLYKISDEKRLEAKALLLSLSRSDVESVRDEILERISKRASIGIIASEKAVRDSSIDAECKKLPI